MKQFGKKAALLLTFAGIGYVGNALGEIEITNGSNDNLFVFIEYTLIDKGKYYTTQLNLGEVKRGGGVFSDSSKLKIYKYSRFSRSKDQTYKMRGMNPKASGRVCAITSMIVTPKNPRYLGEDAATMRRAFLDSSPDAFEQRGLPRECDERFIHIHENWEKGKTGYSITWRR